MWGALWLGIGRFDPRVKLRAEGGGRSRGAMDHAPWVKIKRCWCCSIDLPEGSQLLVTVCTGPEAARCSPFFLLSVRELHDYSSEFCDTSVDGRSHFSALYDTVHAPTSTLRLSHSEFD